ncbi:hypothetical protein [Paenibacillus terrigena]|uniref:hypothetical protein n=1 Tax=Paenibacillus terrigena TaxID=369333 RepID=UPI00036081E3|nr:hypothetical protein [Paenibacillus terrigena]
MKKNFVVSSLLSAMLFTIAALPASASPDVKPIESGKNLNVQSTAAVAKPAIDLLGLVKQYAPDTLQEWEDVLAKQTKHFVKVDNLSHTVTVMKSDTIDSKEVKQMMIKEAVPASVGTENKGTEQQGDVIFVADAPMTASTSFVTKRTKENQLFEDLNKAVEEKNIEAIQSNLAKLLEQMKEEANTVKQGKVVTK